MLTNEHNTNFSAKELAQKIGITEVGGFSVQVLKTLYENDLLLLPSFQRDNVPKGKDADEVRRSILESFLRGYRIPSVQLANLTVDDTPWRIKVEELKSKETVGKYNEDAVIILDGQQRLTEFLRTILLEEKWVVVLDIERLDELKANKFDSIEVKPATHKESGSEITIPFYKIYEDRGVLVDFLGERILNRNDAIDFADVIGRQAQRPVLFHNQRYSGKNAFLAQARDFVNINKPVRKIDNFDTLHSILATQGLDSLQFFEKVAKEEPIFNKMFNMKKFFYELCCGMYQIEHFGRIKNDLRVEHIIGDKDIQTYIVKEYQNLYEKTLLSFRNLVNHKYVEPKISTTSLTNKFLSPFLMFLNVTGGFKNMGVEQVQFFKEVYFVHALLKGRNKSNAANMQYNFVNLLLHPEHPDTITKVVATKRDLQQKDFSSETHNNLIVFINKVRDLGDWENNQKILSEDIQVHHIFPKKFLKDSKQDIYFDRDSVLNKTIISNVVNNSISSHAPAQYIQALKHKNIGLGRTLENHLLKEADLNEGKYENFLRERNTIMKELMQTELNLEYNEGLKKAQ